MKRFAALINENSLSEIQDVIAIASKKLLIQGQSLVLEEDGIVVDDDSLLEYWNKSLFMVLEDGDTWTPLKSRIQLESSPEENAHICKKGNHEIDSHEQPQKSSSSDQDVSQEEEELGANFEQEIVPQTKKSKSYIHIDWENLDVPWEKFDTCTINSIKQGLDSCNDKKKKEVLQLSVHYVVNHVREITDHAPVIAFRSLAEKMCKEYPHVFEDQTSTGERQGPGYISLENKLADRNRYLNRDRQSDCLERTLNLPLKDQKKYRALKAGCLQWQPDFIEGQDANAAELLRKLFLDHSTFDLSIDVNVSQRAQQFADCFPLQRLHINKKDVTISELKELWPCLFTNLFATTHFQILTGRTDSFANNFLKDMVKLFIYKHKTTDIIFNEYEKLEAAKIILSHFDEQLDSVFHEIKDECPVEEIAIKHLYPHIVVFGELPTANTEDLENVKPKYVILVDGVSVSQVESIIEALRLLLISHFNFNQLYAKNCAHFLEYLQRKYMGVYPDDGSRCRSQAIVKKVDSFIRRIDRINATNIA